MQNNDRENFTRQFEKIMQDEIKSSILLVIRLNEPINLKGIARYLGKAETTLYHHLKSLKGNFLELDTEMTESRRGKYYRLTDQTRDIYANSINRAISRFEEIEEGFFSSFSKFEQTGDVDELEQYADIIFNDVRKIRDAKLIMESNFNINRAIQQMALERAIVSANRLDAKEDFNEKLHEIDPRGVFNHIFRSFRITKYTHSLKFTRLIVNFLKDVEMLEKEITLDINENKLSSEEMSYQYFSIFTAPLQSSIEDEKEKEKIRRL